MDFILIYVPTDLPGKRHLYKYWQDEGGLLREVKSLRHYLKSDGYYQASYQKFYSFLLTEYDRVIMMDADGVPLKNLDHLFHIKFPGNVQIAAPQGYWFKYQGLTTWSQNCKCM